MRREIVQIAKFILGYKKQKIKLATPNTFISWMKLVNAGMLSEGNIYCMEYAIRNLVSTNPIIEIGAFCGLSTNVISFYLSINNRPNKLMTVDKWLFEGAENLSNTITIDRYREFVRETYIRNVSFFSQHTPPYTIEELSDDFFDLWCKSVQVTDIMGRQVQLGGNISFAYIDGNHSYDFAKRDFGNVDKYLDRGGFILFDDSSDDSAWEVRGVIDEIKRNPNYEVVMKNPNYLVRKIG